MTMCVRDRPFSMLPVHSLPRLRGHRCGAVLALTAACLASLLPPAGSTHGAALRVRHKPGPVYIRGVATAVGPRGFTLKTTHRGDFSVLTGAATSVIEKGKGGTIRVLDGEDVGVHGFLTGRAIRAITIHIYPTKPKEHSLRGTVASVQPGTIVLTVNGKSVSVRVTRQTPVSVGRNAGSMAQVRPGATVRVRVAQAPGAPLIAVKIYVYLRRLPARHVTIRGTLATLRGSVATIVAGSTRYAVTLTGHTMVRVGNAPATKQSLHAGESVTVYACCAGQALSATSIHIHLTAPHRTTVRLRGRITAIRSGQVTLGSGRNARVVRVLSTTRYAVGSTPTTLSGVRVGDDVSVRAYRSGASLVAASVHVYASSRQEHSVDGVVVAAGRGTLRVRTRAGKQYTVQAGRRMSVVLAGKSIAFSAIVPGDRVRARGYFTVSGALAALQVAVTRAGAKAQVVRGTIAGVGGSRLVIVDASGKHYPVQLAPGVRPLLHGKVAPPAALFPGVHARARGVVRSGTLVASSLTLTVTSRSASGRIEREVRGAFYLRDRSITLRVDLPAGLRAADGHTWVQPAALHVGTDIRVEGYRETASSIRAVHLSVQHPAIDTSAHVVSLHNGITVQTAAGERYQLRFSSASAIQSSRSHQVLRPSDIPPGAAVRVQGTLDSNGMVLVMLLSVRLPSVTVAGQVSAMAGFLWTVRTPSGDVRARLQRATPIAQGSHTLTVADVVIGDDVTVYGYGAAGDTVLVRRILVHRKLKGVDGTVASTTPDGFVLHTAAGEQRVITGVTTLVSATIQNIVPGISLHVTGYLRGDGVILATRIRAGKKNPGTARVRQRVG